MPAIMTNERTLVGELPWIYPRPSAPPPTINASIQPRKRAPNTKPRPPPSRSAAVACRQAPASGRAAAVVLTLIYPLLPAPPDSPSCLLVLLSPPRGFGLRSYPAASPAHRRIALCRLPPQRVFPPLLSQCRSPSQSKSLASSSSTRAQTGRRIPSRRPWIESRE